MLAYPHRRGAELGHRDSAEQRAVVPRMGHAV